LSGGTTGYAGKHLTARNLTRWHLTASNLTRWHLARIAVWAIGLLPLLLGLLCVSPVVGSLVAAKSRLLRVLLRRRIVRPGRISGLLRRRRIPRVVGHLARMFFLELG